MDTLKLWFLTASLTFCITGCNRFHTESIALTPVAPVVTAAYSNKTVALNWPSVTNADYYVISKDRTGTSNFVWSGTTTQLSFSEAVTALTDWVAADYKVAACNRYGCNESPATTALSKQSINYIKAYNTGQNDGFGYSIALSANGTTLAIGAPQEESGAIGVNGDQLDNSIYENGAVYIFSHSRPN